MPEARSDPESSSSPAPGSGLLDKEPASSASPGLEGTSASTSGAALDVAGSATAASALDTVPAASTLVDVSTEKAVTSLKHDGRATTLTSAPNVTEVAAPVVGTSVPALQVTT
jgi:hypothetical protein